MTRGQVEQPEAVQGCGRARLAPHLAVQRKSLLKVRLSLAVFTPGQVNLPEVTEGVGLYPQVRDLACQLQRLRKVLQTLVGFWAAS